MHPFYVMLPLPPPHIVLVFQMVLQVAFGPGAFGIGYGNGCVLHCGNIAYVTIYPSNFNMMSWCSLLVLHLLRETLRHPVYIRVLVSVASLALNIVGN